jgi:predicted acylesterase/phospholipase RssA
VVSIWQTLRHGSTSLLSRGPTPTPSVLWEELDRLFDTLPAGFFALDRYERFLEEFFVRRAVANSFPLSPRPLRILAHDLDSGEPALFGSTGFDHVPISRACIASMAVPPFFSPVRIGGRHYIDSGAAQIGHLDAAVSEGADVIVVVNPMVPVLAERVPTGHGPKSSVRNKGLMWVMNQSIRIGMHHFMRDALSRIALTGETDVLLIEPDPSDAILFMHNPASFAARRKILEYAYRTTRKVVEGWFAEGMPALARAGLRPQEGAT